MPSPPHTVQQTGNIQPTGAKVPSTYSIRSMKTITFLMVLLQPSLVVIDHGHFQYNSVCLGLAMGGAAAIAGGGRRGGEVKFNFVIYVVPSVAYCLLRSVRTDGRGLHDLARVFDRVL